jgi:hypothetical protein
MAVPRRCAGLEVRVERREDYEAIAGVVEAAFGSPDAA